MSYEVVYDLKNKIEDKELGNLKQIVDNFKQKLPEGFEVTSDLSKNYQKINIKSAEKDVDEKVIEKVSKYVKDFENELKNILPQIDLNKSVHMKMKERKKK
jgi:hypothetical protein